MLNIRKPTKRWITTISATVSNVYTCWRKYTSIRHPGETSKKTLYRPLNNGLAYRNWIELLLLSEKTSQEKVEQPLLNSESRREVITWPSCLPGERGRRWMDKTIGSSCWQWTDSLETNRSTVFQLPFFVKSICRLVFGDVFQDLFLTTVLYWRNCVY